MKTVDVAEGLLAKVRAADEARFGAVPPPQDASPEELERFLTARGALADNEADSCSVCRLRC
jgi:hypothetical protein